MKLSLTIIFFTSFYPIWAQSANPEETIIKNVILELFDGYRAGDSARVAATFTSTAILQSVGKNKEGKVELAEPLPVQKFLDYIGGGFSEVHDERLWETQVFYDELMATVWTKYAFFLGNNFHHCGTETFHLRKVNGDWKIFYLVDTRQLEDCQLRHRLSN